MDLGNECSNNAPDLESCVELILLCYFRDVKYGILTNVNNQFTFESMNVSVSGLKGI